MFKYRNISENNRCEKCNGYRGNFEKINNSVVGEWVSCNKCVGTGANLESYLNVLQRELETSFSFLLKEIKSLNSRIDELYDSFLEKDKP